jgi:undecaprenyl-diphosphatase
MLSPFEQAIFLGVIQGLTEFLPISSDGHLALAQMLLDTDGGGLTLSVLLHTGTLFATLIYFRRRIAESLVDLWHTLRRGRVPAPGASGYDVIFVLVASVPTALIGLLLRDAVERWTVSPLATGFGFIVTSLLLTSTLWARPGNVASPTLVAALLIGLAQGLAVAPGISRSGSTIVAALWLGVRSERAFELSMLMSLPAVAGAILLEVVGGHGHGGHAFALVCGAITAFAVGILALTLLRRIVSRGHLAWFALWVLPVALATLALAKAWPG